jgi:hypothetical protein
VSECERRFEVERALAARLATGHGIVTAAMVAAARKHRVHLLLGTSFTTGERAAPYAPALVRELRTHAVTYGRREAVLRDLLAALASAQIDALIVKGAALAYVAYAEPYLRPRVDIDLMIRRDALERAERVLSDLGWVRDIEADAELAAAQRHYTTPLGDGVTEHLDLHWRIVNPPALAGVVSFDELHARSIAVAGLGRSARTCAPGDALFLACLHLAVHHPDAAPDLLWLMDIHLLAESLDAIERTRFCALVARESMHVVCRSCLEDGYRYFQGAATASLLSALDVSADGHQRFSRAMSKAASLYADLAALSSWRERVRLLGEHLFPSMTYLQTKYPRCPRVLLPFASLYRIVAGAPGWFVHGRS